MRRLGWYALCVALAVFVLGSVGLLAANLYVQSHGVQQRIRTAVAASLGLPVSLRKTTVTPWDGVRLDGVTLHQDPSGCDDGPTDLLTAASFRVRLAWWPLLSQRRLVVKQVLLDRPRLTLRDTSDGRSVQNPPAAEPANTVPDEPPGTPPPDVADEAPPAVAEASPPTTSTSEARRSSPARLLLPLVNKLRVRHGEVVSLDRSGQPRYRFEGVNADASTPDPRHARCALWFAKAVPADLPGAALTDYWTAADYDDATGLALHDGHGSVGGGRLTTDFHLRPQGDRWFFTTADQLQNVALGQLTRPSADALPLAEGMLHSTFDLHGFTDDSASIAGGGKVWMDGARLQNFPLLKLVGQVLRIADLSQLEFKQAQLDYRVESNAVRVDGLTLVSNDGQVVLCGQYLMAEDRLDLHGRLTIDRAISHQLPQFIESNFTACGAESPGCRYLEFDITGPRDEPQCNLYDRLTAGPMKGLLDNLLAPKSKNPKNARHDGAKKARPAVGNPTPKP